MYQQDASITQNSLSTDEESSSFTVRRNDEKMTRTGRKKTYGMDARRARIDSRSCWKGMHDPQTRAHVLGLLLQGINNHSNRCAKDHSPPWNESATGRKTSPCSAPETMRASHCRKKYTSRSFDRVSARTKIPINFVNVIPEKTYRQLVSSLVTKSEERRNARRLRHRRGRRTRVRLYLSLRADGRAVVLRRKLP